MDELDHPNIVRVIELLESDDNYYIVMELMLDGSLLEILNKFGRKRISLTERDVANLLDQVVQAISYMHATNIVHRDLKLENLMVQLIKSPDRKSTEIIVKVTDFGFAVRMDPTKDERT